MRLLYKPLGIVAGIFSGRLGKSIFNSLWAKIDDEPPPKAGDGRGSMGKVVAASAVQAAVMAGSAAAVDRLLARVFHYLVGIWPKKPPKPAKD